jgi:predicted nucleic acid-binding protein
MTPVLIDSNVLLDIATDDARWADWSSCAVEAAAQSATLVINPIVYAEVSVGYDRLEEVDTYLPASVYRREPLPFDAGFLAGKAFLVYQRRGGTKWTPMPDFYIGAHAAVAGYRLLTRDPKRYRTYFPTVELVCP